MTIPYRIVRIENNQFAIFPEKYVNGGLVKVNCSFQFDPRTDLSVIRCISTIHYVQEENMLLVLENAMYFAVATEGVANLQKEGKIPADFLRYMATIVVGAARGIIYAKTEGTVLNSVVLPPINLMEIIKGDLPVLKKVVD